MITIQTGPRNARTDPETGLRFYSWEGVEYPSVTTIRRMAGIPWGLHTWVLGQVIEHVIGKSETGSGHSLEIASRLAMASEIDLRNGPGSPLGLKAIKAVLTRELRAAATAERDKAAALGTAVHDAAASGRTVEEVDAELQPRLSQYLDWLDRSGAEILGTEFQVWNPTIGYAGTADLLVRLRDGSIYVVDLKTGKSILSEYSLQVIAYLMGEFVGQDNVRDEPLTELLQQATGMAVLHLADDRWEFLALRPDSSTWDAFRGLLTFAVWMAAHQTPASITIASRKGAAPASAEAVA